MLKGQTFDTVFGRPALPEYVTQVILTIDPGYIDPTIMNVWGMSKFGVWRNFARYRTQRVDFPQIEKIIAWLDETYMFSYIGIDTGAGGNGTSILQGLHTRDEYKGKMFDKRVVGISFNEALIVGRNEETHTDIKKDVKAIGTEELVKRIESGQIIFSELDVEGISELERISKTKTASGADRYFVASENNKGKSAQDHHYASCVVFAMLIRDFRQNKKTLGVGSWLR